MAEIPSSFDVLQTYLVDRATFSADELAFIGLPTSGSSTACRAQPLARGGARA